MKTLHKIKKLKKIQLEMKDTTQPPFIMTPNSVFVCLTAHLSAKQKGWETKGCRIIVL